MDKQEIRQIIREEIQNILESNIILDPHLLAAWIIDNKSELSNGELYDGQDTTQVLNFLTNGRPSPIYIQTIIKNLVDLGYPVTLQTFKKESELKPSSSAMVDYENFGDPSQIGVSKNNSDWRGTTSDSA